MAAAFPAEGAKAQEGDHVELGARARTAETLLDLVKTRFGTLSPGRRARVQSADTATLDTWLHRFAKGEDLGSILADGHSGAKVVALKSKASVRPGGRSPADRG